MAADVLFGKGNEAFVEENFQEAIEFYTKSIEEDGNNDAVYCNRAQGFLKLDKFKDALEDCMKAISLNAENPKAYLRKGQAYFHLGQYEEALESLEFGQKIDSSNPQFGQWIGKCRTKHPVAGNGTGPNESVTTSTDSQPSPIPVPTEPKIRYEWYQTETHVIITILIKKVKKEDASIDIHENSLSATIKLPTGSDYSLMLDLAHRVVPNQSLAKILASKIEIKLKKADGIRWSKLEGDATQIDPVKHFNPNTAQSDIQKYPSSSHYTRDWDKVVSDIKQEEKDEKPEGDAALNQLFQQIYADGSDEVKKAMNKSFAESGGTVLSTNWKDIAEKPTEVKPPDGMEFKQW